MTTAEMKAVITAFEEGKTIEFRRKDIQGAIWNVPTTPSWNFDRIEYRIKPEPRIVPYDNVMEVEKDKWVVGKTNNWVYRINAICYGDNTVKVNETWYTLRNLMENYTYEDGSPCGKLVEE